MGVTVNVVQLGQKKEVQLDDGATHGDLIEQEIPNLESVSARTGGVDIRQKAEELIEDGATITITPKSLKNGS